MMENQNKLQSEKVIPPGYKLTDVGVIPEDWLLEKLGLHASFRTGPFGSALHKSDYVEGGIPIVNPMQIVDGKVIPTFSMAVSDDAAKKLADFRFSVGDVVIGRRGDMGRCAVITEKENGWLCGTGSMIVRVKQSCDAAFLQRVLSSASVISAIENASVGTTMVNLNQGTLRELQIVIPRNKNEQTAIANTLSDTDELIVVLEQLITKKKAIKTATMQQLLTGRTRLPQFSKYPDGTFKGYKPSDFGLIPEDWNIVGIQDVGVVDPESLSVNTQRNYEFNYIALENIDAGSLLKTTKHTFSTAPSRARRVLRFNDLLVSTVRPNLMSHYFISNEVQNLIGSTGFSVIRCKQKKFCASYLYQHLFHSVINKQIDMLITGSNYPAINSTDVKNLKFPAGSLEEQTTIATILSDMDAELEALGQKLAKVRDLKQGMIQQLLTGRIRLPLDRKP